MLWLELVEQSPNGTDSHQARREPQRGPGKHYRGALSPPPILYVLRLRCKRGERCPLTIRLGVWGSVVSSSSGVWGRAPAENGFYAYFRPERSHLEHHFQYFWATAGPLNVAGPGKTFPLPAPLNGPDSHQIVILPKLNPNRDLILFQDVYKCIHTSGQSGN